MFDFNKEFDAVEDEDIYPKLDEALDMDFDINEISKLE